MRESIGTISLLNFIFIYIFIVMAIIAGTISYYRAYRVNNVIVRAIEKYEGYNKLSAEAAEEGLVTLAYERINIDCAKNRKQYVDKTHYITGKLANSGTYKTDGYCVYRYENDTSFKTKSGSLATTDRYDTYEVVTYMSLNIPFLNNVLKMKTSAKTLRIYHFAD